MVKYEQYKDSDIDWVGKVPTSWNRSRIKFLLSHSSAGVWGEDEKGNKNDIVCFRAADFDYSHGCLKLDNNTVRNIQQKQLEGRVLHKRDLLIEKSGGGDATPVGRIVRFNYDGIATRSNFMHFISVDKYNDDNYLFYYFYAMYANNVNVLYFNQTTGIQNLKVSEYLGQTIFLPSLKEQMTIANYLDKKCSEIDKVISAQQKRIALLQELKQSVITHAVTKGLNPNVEMDAAEEDWINRLPASWGKAKLKYYIHLVNGRAYSQPELLSEGKYKVLRVGNFFTNDTWYYSNMELEEDKYCNNGDLLYAWSASFGPYIWNQDRTIYHYHIWKVCYNECMDKMYVYYMLKAITNFKLGDIHGSTMVHITMESMNNSIIPIPSLDEQKDIASYLDKKCASIDSSISKAQHQVDLLQEYKQSLINEVVTGKRKVC